MGSDSIDLLTEAYLYQGEVNPVSALNNQGEVIAQHVYTSRVGGQRLANKSIESDPIDCDPIDSLFNLDQQVTRITRPDNQIVDFNYL